MTADERKGLLGLFATGFTQVFFVAFNVFAIAHQILWLIGFTSFAVSYVWSHNVRKVAFGTEWHRVVYALGAAFGCLAGYGAGKLFTYLFQ